MRYGACAFQGEREPCEDAWPGSLRSIRAVLLDPAFDTGLMVSRVRMNESVTGAHFARVFSQKKEGGCVARRAL